MLTWTYPTAAHFYSAMAALVSSEANLQYFLNRAATLRTPLALELGKHNIDLFTHAQADAIAWASV